MVGSFRLVDAVSLQGHGLVALQAVTVHPLSQRAVAVPQQRQDGTTGRLQSVGLASVVTLEANANGARDGVDGQRVDGIAVQGVDGVAHRLVACECSLQGQGRGAAPLVCHFRS